ncbi:MAG: hypothetical protein RBR82_17540 [Pseudomonas sp.]|nr:hypothetical protein [Pseudomonas sp.]
MRVKNANSEFVAKAKFATYIEKQYPARGQLVIHSISKDNPMLRMFDDIFKKNNPFDKFAK